MIALVSSGKCFGVGHNKLGAVGVESPAVCTSFTLIPKLADVAFIAAGQNVSMFIDKGQKLYSCGSALLHGNVSKTNQMSPALVRGRTIRRWRPLRTRRFCKWPVGSCTVQPSRPRERSTPGAATTSISWAMATL